MATQNNYEETSKTSEAHLEPSRTYTLKLFNYRKKAPS